jgi:hypothetical protein
MNHLTIQVNEQGGGSGSDLQISAVNIPMRVRKYSVHLDYRCTKFLSERIGSSLSLSRRSHLGLVTSANYTLIAEHSPPKLISVGVCGDCFALRSPCIQGIHPLKTLHYTCHEALQCGCIWSNKRSDEK